ncbi:MAG: hypothetical protein ACO2OT_03355 [Candidatus Caldipriscus sp.]
MLRRDEEVWQGATWMTEAKGGSDLGNKAQLALVATRFKGEGKGVRSLGLFLLPRYRENGELNYFIRRIKDKIGTRSVPTGEVELKNSQAYLLGDKNNGIYTILSVA